MHQECSRYTTIHYVAAQSQQQRAWGTRPVASVLSCAPALSSLDLANSFSTWLPKTLSGMSVCLCCSSSSTSFKDPLGELQILLNDQGFSGTGLWLIPEPHSALHSLCSKTAGPRTNTQPAPTPALRRGAASQLHSLGQILFDSERALRELFSPTPAPSSEQVRRHWSGSHSNTRDLGGMLPDQGVLPSALHSQGFAQGLAFTWWVFKILCWINDYGWIQKNVFANSIFNANKRWALFRKMIII